MLPSIHLSTFLTVSNNTFNDDVTEDRSTEQDARESKSQQWYYEYQTHLRRLRRMHRAYLSKQRKLQLRKDGNKSSLYRAPYADKAGGRPSGLQDYSLLLEVEEDLVREKPRHNSGELPAVTSQVLPTSLLAQQSAQLSSSSTNPDAPCVYLLRGDNNNNKRNRKSRKSRQSQNAKGQGQRNAEVIDMVALANKSILKDQGIGEVPSRQPLVRFVCQEGGSPAVKRHNMEDRLTLGPSVTRFPKYQHGSWEL